LRQAGQKVRPSSLRPWKNDDAVRRQERISLTKILEFGFIREKVHSDSKTSCNRHYVILKEGATVDELLDFCVKHMKGSPIPENKPSNRDFLLKMFEAAKYDARIMDIESHSGDALLPQSGMI